MPFLCYTEECSLEIRERLVGYLKTNLFPNTLPTPHPQDLRHGDGGIVKIQLQLYYNSFPQKSYLKKIPVALKTQIKNPESRRAPQIWYSLVHHNQRANKQLTQAANYVQKSDNRKYTEQ